MRKNRQATEKDDSKPDSDVKHHEMDNVKQTNNTRKSVPPAATIGHLPSFSSLFTNNPDIPSIQSFTQYIVSNLEGKMELTEMTSVQQKAIPVLLQGHDAMIKSQTGSGKTLSYAVPVVQNLQARSPCVSRYHGPYAIVIVPTRESDAAWYTLALVEPSTLSLTQMTATMQIG
ncbi:putative ATP-dependent RNA helicase DDX31 [Lamellibrachia satsuma]|nr:putative ATP-dependent RNA helicase DDX31 [Lamellibrachia satsuma]